MNHTIEAVYENGVLRPIRPLEGIEEQSRVQITIQARGSQPHLLDPGLGTMPVEDAEAILRVVEEECERVDPRDWR